MYSELNRVHVWQNGHFHFTVIRQIRGRRLVDTTPAEYKYPSSCFPHESGPADPPYIYNDYWLRETKKPSAEVPEAIHISYRGSVLCVNGSEEQHASESRILLHPRSLRWVSAACEERHAAPELPGPPGLKLDPKTDQDLLSVLIRSELPIKPHTLRQNTIFSSLKNKDYWLSPLVWPPTLAAVAEIFLQQVYLLFWLRRRRRRRRRRQP